MGCIQTIFNEQHVVLSSDPSFMVMLIMIDMWDSSNAHPFVFPLFFNILVTLSYRNAFPFSLLVKYSGVATWVGGFYVKTAVQQMLQPAVDVAKKLPPEMGKALLAVTLEAVLGSLEQALLQTKRVAFR